MNEFSRRTFLKGMGAVAAIALVPMLDSEPPKKLILWGDGIHDDGPAIQALFDGREEEIEVRASKVIVQDGLVFLGAGTYLVGQTLEPKGNTTITNSRFIAKKSVNPLFRFKGNNNALLYNIIETET